MKRVCRACLLVTEHDGELCLECDYESDIDRYPDDYLYKRKRTFCNFWKEKTIVVNNRCLECDKSFLSNSIYMKKFCKYFQEQTEHFGDDCLECESLSESESETSEHSEHESDSDCLNDESESDYESGSDDN